MTRVVSLLITCVIFCPLLLKANKFFIADGDVTGFIAAIHQANQNNKADTIYLALRGKYVFTNPIASTTDGHSALPDVTLDQSFANKIIVYGNGSVLERDAGAAAFRIWMVFGGSLELHDVVIRNGKLDGNPGQNGAGIASYGELVIYNSTFINNTASFLGGALYISISSPAELTNCTITGNTAAYGSAIYFYSSSASVTHCTIVGNPCTNVNGAGLYNQLILDDPNRRVFLKNSIVALNTVSDGTQSDVSGVFRSLFRNIVGANNDPNAQFWLPVGSPTVYLDHVGTSDSPVDPLLNPLADNGGLTHTMSIQSDNSLAFNNGGLPSVVIPTDQAGNNRIGNAEIGSLELNNNPTLNPVIEIRQAATVISNGGMFDFGDVINGQSSGAIEFKIHNTGFFQKLNLLSKPKIILTDVNANELIVDQSITEQEIAGGDATSFFVRFVPSSAGSKLATISIASNDTGKTIYTIQLSGNAVSHIPVVDVSLDVTAVSPVCEGTSTSVTITDSETGVDYEVFKGTVAVSSTVAGGGDLVIPVASENFSAGDHILKVLGIKSGVGSDTLNTKPVVHIDALTSIITQPSGDTKALDQSVSFTVTATGTGLTYQWHKGTSPLSDDSRFSGITSSTLTISNLAMADAGDYNCVVISACGDITSSNATLIVNNIVTAIEKRDKEDVTVFPNPSGGEVTVRGGADRVWLVDVRGAVIREWNVRDSTFTIDIKDASPGLYLLKGQRDNDVVFLKRIVKE